ncbi:hypothetical protein [Anaerorhabdus sp.]|uniref:hypothetical protein n=1 Tax=Anaerorhabdus sp. TaxID=1872524 RepID=UPI002FC99BFB
MIFTELVKIFVEIAKFLINLIPPINLDISSLSSWITSGTNLLNSASGLVCLFFPMDVVRFCLGLVLVWCVFEFLYWTFLYVVKIFK